MNILLTSIRWVMITFAALFAAAVVLFVYESLWMPEYDDADPRYVALAKRLDEVRRSQDSGAGNARDIDLSELNEGQWTTACVFGGYNNPLQEIENRRANVAVKDRERLMELESRGFRLFQVEEFELMIAYVDTKNDAHFVHFGGGVGSGGQGFEKCITKPQTVVDL